MTEEQIRDGYERLDSALHAPQDAFDRVERRIGARRRSRRIGVAAGTAAVVAAVGGYAALSMGGSDDGREGLVAVDPPPYSLVMTRPDGSTFTFDDLTISCDPPAPAGGEAGTGDKSRVYLSSPFVVDGEQVTQPFVLIEVDLAKLDEPRTLSLPIESTDGSTESLPLSVFIADTEGAPDGNEVVSSSGSTGTVRVTQASCDPTPVLELEVDATLASEEVTDAGENKQSLELEGFIR
ncbi:hypothetical protein [Nocardioides sp.]|uniref:hypothetical protein n=1 Tax=Nocardioides sp. TaxID=35761 RepID=UPI002C6445A5|nr:hypothetical protein [Nocardioides sp.]HXH80651.1 hypothetical protein [Nocardioides sp.]